MCKVGNGDFFSSVQKGPTASPTSDSDEEAQVLEDGTILNISAKMDEKLRFVYPIDPLVVQSVKCAIGGGTGDGDLYVGWDSPIDFESQGQGDVSCKYETTINCFFSHSSDYILLFLVRTIPPRKQRKM